jgi:hypothetical protein
MAPAVKGGVDALDISLLNLDHIQLWLPVGSAGLVILVH